MYCIMMIVLLLGLFGVVVVKLEKVVVQMDWQGLVVEQMCQVEIVLVVFDYVELFVEDCGQVQQLLLCICQYLGECQIVQELLLQLQVEVFNEQECINILMVCGYDDSCQICRYECIIGSNMFKSCCLIVVEWCWIEEKGKVLINDQCSYNMFSLLFVGC